MVFIVYDLSLRGYYLLQRVSLVVAVFWSVQMALAARIKAPPSEKFLDTYDVGVQTLCLAEMVKAST